MSEPLTPTVDLSSTRSGFPMLFRQKYVWLALIPFAVLFAVVAYRGVREWQADQSNQLQFAQWAKAGVPYDNASIEKSYLERTFAEGRADWARASRLSYWGTGIDGYNQLPYLWHHESPAVLVPDENIEQWPNKTFMASYLDEMQPVIDLVERASTHPTPVRFPMHFQGFNTLLPHVQHSRNIVRVLSLDCDYAYSQNDTKRALRDLSLMRSTVDAYDSRDCMVVLLVNNALRGMRFGAIRRTLTHCAWDESQLKALKELVSAPKDLAAAMRETWLNERALTLSGISDLTYRELYALVGRRDDTQLGSARFSNQSIRASDQQLLIKYYNDVLAIGADSLLQWKKQTEELEREANSNSNTLAAALIPATSQVMTAEIRNEETRRWTLTGIALRQYHQQHGNWPEQLSDLETLGLRFDDYSNLRGELFGYEVDGKTAYLWKRKDTSGEESYVSATRPVEPEEESKREQPKDYLLELR